jgi:flavin-dependent dehydrogenase
MAERGMMADSDSARRPPPARVWDVIVVGAGPAGAATAIDLARRGLEVLVIDRETLPRGKLCGSCLSAAAVREVERLCAGRPRQPHGSSPGRGFLAALGAVPLDHVRLAAGGTTARIGMAGGMVLSRDRLDAAVLDLAIEAGAVFLPRHSCVRVVEDADAAPTEAGVVIGLADGSAAGHELRCRLAVMATGLADHVRIGVASGGSATGMSPRSAGRQRRVRPGSRVGVGTVLPATAELAAHPTIAGLPPGELVMAVARTGYCGIVRLEDGRLDLAAAVDRGSLAASPAVGVSRLLGDALGLADTATAAVAAILAASPWRATPPLTHSTPLVAGSTGRILRVGDAAGYVEPFTGEGIGWALASGRLLAAAVTTSPDTAAGLLPAATAAARYVAAHARHFRPRHARCGRVARGLRIPSVVRAVVRTAGHVPWVARQVATAVVGGGLPGGSGR